ncbi:MAG TPA: transglycosylase SLT domain-containing protein [Candidatus Obscuribacterales bacterium]
MKVNADYKNDYKLMMEAGKSYNANLYRKQHDSSWLLMGCLVLAFAVLFVGGCQKMACADEIDMAKIMMIESHGNPLAHNKADDSRGLFQITPIVLQEWNNYNRSTPYQMSSLWNPAINEKIARWYMLARIPAMFRAYKIKDTVENRIIAWNAGISYLVKGKPLPKTTRKYLAKYRGEK